MLGAKALFIFRIARKKIIERKSAVQIGLARQSVCDKTGRQAIIIFIEKTALIVHHPVVMNEII